MPSETSITWYDVHAEQLTRQYETLPAQAILGWLEDLLPPAPGLILDVGAGSGRDAAWLTSLGHDVVAVEPAAGMRVRAQFLHPDPRIRWLDDRLPALARTFQLGLTFDAILLGAVWMHVPQAERPRAFRKLTGLLKPGGLLALTLRYGPFEPERHMHAVDPGEIEELARAHGIMVVRESGADDALGRQDIRWTHIALRVPDDGTGGLPLLRHIILNDAKSATYKLGLLRALCRIADGAAGLAREAGQDHVALPLGAVALAWLRLYLPLVQANLPQAPTNLHGAEKLGFAKAGFRELLSGIVSRQDLRVGAHFGGEVAGAVRAALQEAAETITRMPATFMTYPNGGPVLPVAPARPPRLAGPELTLDAEFLAGFGEMRVPRELWDAMRRFAVWIEPALIAEWQRLMRLYGQRQDRALDEAVIAAAMVWAEPSREVALPRQLALRLIEEGRGLHCVWSGRRLDAAVLDIDHCLPWSAWPCGDLWNLLPAHRTINQHQKRERLPSEAALLTARAPLLEWWQSGYLEGGNILPRRFLDEARASLPGLADAGDDTASPDAVFTALGLQRLRLRHDQGVPEWAGFVRQA